MRFWTDTAEDKMPKPSSFFGVESILASRKLPSPTRDEVNLPYYVVQTGTLNEVLGNEESSYREDEEPVVTGVGTTILTPSEIPAISEALERYSANLSKRHEVILESADALGDRCLELDLLPVCSDDELRNPACPVLRPSKKKPMRWTRGTDLLTGQDVFVPTIMAFTRCGPIADSERFWLTTSSGCASHTNLGEALMSALLELIERDALSIMWLQKMSVPRLSIDLDSVLDSEEWRSYLKTSEDVECSFYLIPHDSGIPVVYGIMRSRCNEILRTLVGCAAAFDPKEATLKVLRDLMLFKRSCRFKTDTPQSWDQFYKPHHGALFMAHEARERAF